MPPSKNASQHADHTQLFATMDKDFALRSQDEFLPPQNKFCLFALGKLVLPARFWNDNTCYCTRDDIFTDCLRDWSRKHGISNVDGPW